MISGNVRSSRDVLRVIIVGIVGLIDVKVSIVHSDEYSSSLAKSLWWTIVPE
jgi:hypothetical protein